MRRRCPSSWELLLSQLFSAVQGPQGLGRSLGSSGGWNPSGFQRSLSLERPDPQLALPFPLSVVQDLVEGREAEDSVRGVVNDLLTGKQSSQGWKHDLLAIMPPTALPRPPSCSMQAEVQLSRFPKNSPSCRAPRWPCGS